jgi:tRNA(Ile)-lysidine synthase TilS/MesJ
VISNPKRFFNHLHKKIGGTIQEHQLIKPNDRILIGLSGGKDSLILAETLALRKKYFPFHFELFAAHVFISNIGYRTDIAFLENFCKSLDIPFHLVELEAAIKKNKSPCFICSWYRRKTLFELTQKNRCNKLAFGHHMDDAIETLLMNMAYHGSISSIPYSMPFFDGRIEVIRPLLDCPEKKLKEFARYKNYPDEIITCPESKKTGRNSIKKILKELDQLTKDARINIFRCIGNQYPDYLPLKKKPGQQEDKSKRLTGKTVTKNNTNTNKY